MAKCPGATAPAPRADACPLQLWEKKARALPKGPGAQPGGRTSWPEHRPGSSPTGQAPVICRDFFPHLRKDSLSYLMFCSKRTLPKLFKPQPPHNLDLHLSPTALSLGVGGPSPGIHLLPDCDQAFREMEPDLHLHLSLTKSQTPGPEGLSGASHGCSWHGTGKQPWGHCKFHYTCYPPAISLTP